MTGPTQEEMERDDLQFIAQLLADWRAFKRNPFRSILAMREGREQP